VPLTVEPFVGEVIVTVGYFPSLLEGIRSDVKEQLELKVPNYKEAASKIRSGLEGLTDRIDAVLKQFGVAKADEKTPEDFKKYIASAEPRYEQMKKLADELLKKMGGLGELKQLDELRQYKDTSIAVLGENDLKVLPVTSIYKTDSSRFVDAGDKLKPRFAGEQQISTALLTLTAKEKKKVVFVRSGGPPVATSLPMVGYNAPLTEVTDRLRDCGMEVLDKDISGRWAMQMQMQMQGMPMPPEPTDEQIKDAVWVVVSMPVNPREMMMNPAGSTLGPKVSEHLKNGGSAMILIEATSEKMDFLKEWGIETRPDYLVVHEKIESTGGRQEDFALDWQREQPVFILNKYGDHPLVKPLNSLDALFVPLIPVNTVDAKGVKVTKILPVPNDPRTWADTDWDQIRQGKTVTFDPKKEGTPDLPGPFWGGAIAEKEGGKGRLIVLGNRTFAFDDYVGIPNVPASKKQDRFVPRFPGGSELFVNSVFWLANMDTMIAISPQALETPRVAAMTDGVRDWFRVGLMIVALPFLAIATGAFVYLKRRD